MTRALYVLGGPGSGKSSVTRAMIDGWEPGEYVTLQEHFRFNPLKGHYLDHPLVGVPGVYLGHLRDQFPGTDALGMTANRAAVEWAASLDGRSLSLVVGEGSRLTNAEFLSTLARDVELTVVRLVVDPEVGAARRASRPDATAGWAKPVAGKIRAGAQSAAYARGQETRARNTADAVRDIADVVDIDANAGLPEVIAKVRASFSGS